MFAIFIPVYAFLFMPLRSALAGETRDFLACIAKIQWGLMLAVYCVSHVPALLMLEIPGYEHEGAKLLLFVVVVVQLSDVLQYVCCASRRRSISTCCDSSTPERRCHIRKADRLTTEPNGPSAIALVCGTSLSLMDPCVPVKAPVAGVAIAPGRDGLVRSSENQR
jgi:hypothetical protein